ncbi:MAG: hypothetical protein ABTQ29_06050 [Siculibacillus sp.]
MRARLLLTAAVLAVAAVPALAASTLSEKAALAEAVAILQGDPYGDTAAEVTANIVDRRLVPRRDTVCHGGDARVWAFRVVIPHPKTNPDGRIDGWLVIDAAKGGIVCANLPFLN